MDMVNGQHWTATTEGRIAYYSKNPYVVEILVFTKHHDTLGEIPGETLHFCHHGDGQVWVDAINARHAAGKMPYRAEVERVVRVRDFAAQVQP